MGDSKGCYRPVLTNGGEYGLLSPRTAYQYFVRGKELSDCLSILISSAGCEVATPEEMKALFVEAERRANWNDAELQGGIGKSLCFADYAFPPAGIWLPSGMRERLMNGNTFC